MRSGFLGWGGFEADDGVWDGAEDGAGPDGFHAWDEADVLEFAAVFEEGEHVRPWGGIGVGGGGDGVDGVAVEEVDPECFAVFAAFVSEVGEVGGVFEEVDGGVVDADLACAGAEGGGDDVWVGLEGRGGAAGEGDGFADGLTGDLLLTGDGWGGGEGEDASPGLGLPVLWQKGRGEAPLAQKCARLLSHPAAPLCGRRRDL